MKNVLIFLFFTSSLLSYTQILDNSNGTTFGDKPFFNTNFIKFNKIKTIKGYYSTKAEASGIIKSNDIYQYDFNKKGELTREFKTKYSDTIINEYEYDLRGNLTIHRKSDKKGYHTYAYNYDSLNRVISKEYRHDINKSKNRLNFELDKSYIISGETYSYETTPVGLKKSYFNHSGKLYQTEFYYEDKNGYLTKFESQLLTGRGKRKTEFLYGDKGLIIEKKSETVFMKTTTNSTKFEYDENQNVLAQHYYRNGEYLTEYQIIYSEATGLLDVILTRDVKLNFITIIKLTDYSFYN